jgi:MT0933-like antitoxin protein
MFDKLKKSVDDIKDKVVDAVDEHGPKIGEGIDKAAGFVDEKTGHKYSDKIDKATGVVKGGLDKLDGKSDSDRGTPPASPTPPADTTP